MLTKAGTTAPADWQRHDGERRPRTGERKLYVRIRVLSRAHVETRQEPRPAKDWKRWKNDGGPGDIIEWRYAE
jgi:hypothetical protein